MIQNTYSGRLRFKPSCNKSWPVDKGEKSGCSGSSFAAKPSKPSRSRVVISESLFFTIPDCLARTGDGDVNDNCSEGGNGLRSDASPDNVDSGRPFLFR